MLSRSPSSLVSRGTLIVAAVVFLAGALTGAAIAVWHAEPAVTEDVKPESNKRDRRRLIPRIVDVV